MNKIFFTLTAAAMIMAGGCGATIRPAVEKAVPNAEKIVILQLVGSAHVLADVDGKQVLLQCDAIWKYGEVLTSYRCRVAADGSVVLQVGDEGNG